VTGVDVPVFVTAVDVEPLDGVPPVGVVPLEGVPPVVVPVVPPVVVDVG